ncbi:hypothetical protein PGTUg99_021656 [Puccinia graminis f. sp. tritici]|uniref:Uncharacterized protein n=1 Tax=Puccinia graminis f. sp. tritici TaxID=56615 RepID=A0A5B0Q3W5_PUCGR|nr:hypothetical protein PGTUg99_021656 [Puccinia graminis f. sp. tritici]
MPSSALFDWLSFQSEGVGSSTTDELGKTRRPRVTDGLADRIPGGVSQGCRADVAKDDM